MLFSVASAKVHGVADDKEVRGVEKRPRKISVQHNYYLVSGVHLVQLAAAMASPKMQLW